MNDCSAYIKQLTDEDVYKRQQGGAGGGQGGGAQQLHFLPPYPQQFPYSPCLLYTSIIFFLCKFNGEWAGKPGSRKETAEQTPEARCLTAIASGVCSAVS